MDAFKGPFEFRKISFGIVAVATRDKVQIRVDKNGPKKLG